MYIQLGDKQKFADLMKEAIEKDPNNHILYFNLGVITAEQETGKARSYYESAIELVIIRRIAPQLVALFGRRTRAG